MYPQYQTPRSPYTLPLKLLAGSAVLFVLSLGFCGAGALSGGSHFSGFFVGAGLLCLGVSGITFLVAILWLIVAAISGSN